MKFPLPADTFPPLALSEEDEHRLEETAEVIVQKTVQQYHEYLTVHKGVVDEKRWKKIKTRDSLRSYTERRASLNADNDGSSCASNSSSSSSTHNEASNTNRKPTTALLTVGSMSGTLDDVMYCVVNASVEDVMLKSAYTEDSFVDWRLLATIIKPRERDPYRCVTIKWGVKKNPPLVGTVLRIRDVVYVESSGTAVTPSGERVGYMVYHSVAIPEIRELSELHIMRLELSACLLVRQRDDKTVETYGRALFSPTGDVPRSLVALNTADVALSVCKYAHCAEMKKLTRVLSSSREREQRQPRARFMSAASASSIISTSRASSSLSSLPTACALCSRGVGGLRSSFARSCDKFCRICDERVCSRCRVHKTIYLPDKVHHAEQKKLTGATMTFCTRCIHSVASASSHTFAVLDVRAAQGESVDYGLQVFVQKADG
ncbi:hypothetical protein Gpo141_00003895 [Globisporangium polare]